MLGAAPLLVGLAPLEEREAGDPQKFPMGFVDEVESFAELQPELAGDKRGGFGAFDLLLGAHGDDEVAGFCAGGFGEVLYVFWADQFFYGRRCAFGRDLYEVSSARAEGLGFLGEIVELLA